MKIKNKITSIVLAAALALPTFSGCLPKAYTGELIINEIMAKNTSFFTDTKGNCPDYVELYNPTDAPVRLSDWFISDEELKPAKHQLPDVTLEAKGYCLVLCDGENYYDAENNEIHASFSISSKGETIYLMSKSGKTAKLEIKESLQNISYGRVEDGTAAENTYMWFASPTPGKINSGNYSLNAAEVVAKVESALIITEFSSSNSETLFSPDGSCYGFVTVKNITDKETSLNGYSLSDKSGKPEKWHFPSELVLKPNETLTVWCSGKDTVEENTVHTNFKLNSKDSELLLSLAGKAVHKIDLEVYPEGIGVSIDGADLSEKYKKLGFDTLYESIGEIQNTSLMISEVSAVKSNGADEAFDWIELFNPTDSDIELEGYCLSDDADERARFVFPEKTIEAKGYLLIYCAGVNPEGTKKNSLYTSFKLNTGGERLYITNDRGITLDIFDTGKLRSGVTSGRAPNGSGERVFFAVPTPGKENDSKTYGGYAFNPQLNRDGGYVASGTEIKITSSEGDTVYRYTLDGSIPTKNSPEFKGITVNKNTVLRVRAFNESKLSSDVITATYLLENENVSGLPFVCLASDPEGLFSEKSGIFATGSGASSSFPYSGANFWKDWEREANFEYFVNGQKVIDALSGIKIFGQYSRAYDQKSVAVYFRGDYGCSSVTYPFFEDSDHSTLTSLVLRAGGQDQNQTRFRDAYCSQLMKGHTSLVFQDWQPIAVYINGEYWGLYGLREKINAEWLDMYGAVDGDNLDLIKGNKTAKAGTNEAWLELRDYVKSHDLSKDEYYRYVESQVDIDNFIDYLITEIFFCNGDTGNVKFYKERSDSGKWRWIMYDFDMTLRNESLWDSYNAFEKLFNPAGHGSGNNFYSHLQCGLMENSEFRDNFISRFAELLNTVFMPENMEAELDRMVAQVEKEMDRHCERWGKPATKTDWQEEVDNLYRIIGKRRDHVKKQLIEFVDLTDREVAELFPNG